MLQRWRAEKSYFFYLLLISDEVREEERKEKRFSHRVLMFSERNFIFIHHASFCSSFAFRFCLPRRSENLLQTVDLVQGLGWASCLSMYLAEKALRIAPIEIRHINTRQCCVSHSVCYRISSSCKHLVPTQVFEVKLSWMHRINDNVVEHLLCYVTP